VTPLYVTNCLN